MKLYIGFLILFAFTVSSCKKQNDIGLVSRTYVNAFPVTMYWDFYKTRQDYYNNTNVFLKDTIKSGDSITITFPKNSLFYGDLYSADFSLTNWSADTNNILFYSCANTGTHLLPIALSTQVHVPSVRGICLGSGAKSVWKAVDFRVGYFDSDGNGADSSIYPSISDNDRYMEVTFKKDFTQIIAFKDSSARVHTLINSYSCNQIQCSYTNNQPLTYTYIYFRIGELYNLNGYTAVGTQAYRYTTLDTLSGKANVPNHQCMYTLVREK